MNKRVKCGKKISSNDHDKIALRDLATESNCLRHSPPGEVLVKVNDKTDKISEIFNKPDDKDELIKVLQEKLAHTNARLYECKNTCLTLRQEVNKAQKLLCNEIGKSVTINGLSSHPGGWRGRSQQIQELQHKLNELQDKLHEQNRISRCSSISLDNKSVSSSKSFDRERKQYIENLGKKLRQAEVALESNKKKFDIAKARIRVLENDLNTTKRNNAILNERKEHDDQLIDALNGQLRAMDGRYRNKEIELRKERDKIEKEYIQVKNELSSAKLQVEQLRKKIGERQTEINSNRLNTSETELNHQSTSLTTPGTIQDSDEYKILGLAAEAEREKLLELVTVLNQRLSKATTEIGHVSELLRHEKNKNVKLEGKVQRLEADKLNISKLNNGYRARFVKSSTSVSSTKEQFDIDQMNYKLELLEEECLTLKARLATVQQEKSADLTTYKQMYAEIKKKFQNSYAERKRALPEDTEQSASKNI